MAERALIVEDDPDVANALQEELAALGYAIDWRGDGKSGLDAALENEYAFIVLDLTLPKLEGTEVCKRVREKRPDQPIIVLSAKSDELNKVLHLELGADDYVSKPFSMSELKARIKAVLRRSEGRQKAAGQQNAPGEEIVCGGLVINVLTRAVTLDGRPIDLTSGEFEILALLAAHPGRVFDREQITEALHGAPMHGYDAAITSHINRIRSKLEPDPSKPVYLQTVRGVGYRVVRPE